MSINFVNKSDETVKILRIKSDGQTELLQTLNQDDQVSQASDANTFREALIKNASLKNIYNLRWICLRGPGNWEKLKKKKNKLLLNKLFKFRKYLWGSSEGWFSWSARGKLKKQKLNNLTEDNFVTFN